MSTAITVLLYAVAIIHCLTDRVIAPFLLDLFHELASDGGTDTDVLPVLAVVPAPVEATVETAVVAPVKKARPARRRRTTSKKATAEVAV